MIEDKGLYPITILNLNKYELDSFSRIKFMLEIDILNIDLYKLTMKFRIPVSRLQRLREKSKLFYFWEPLLLEYFVFIIDFRFTINNI